MHIEAFPHDVIDCTYVCMHLLQASKAPDTVTIHSLAPCGYFFIDYGIQKHLLWLTSGLALLLPDAFEC